LYHAKEIGLKFIKRPIVIKNILLFCLLSLFFLSVIESLEGGVSALDFKQFISRLRGDFLLVAGSMITFLSIYKGARFSPYLFLVFCSYIILRSFYVFFIDLDKVILFLIFFYSIVSYNFYLFLKMELREPFYNPSFPTNILPSFEYKKLPIVIKKDSKSYEAYLTNWGENGFFAQVSDAQKVRGSLDIEITIEGQTFFATGEVMTTNEAGVGVKVTKNPVPDLGWSDYYGIINELGFRPSYS
jgi:hypothetical protein